MLGDRFKRKLSAVKSRIIHTVIMLAAFVPFDGRSFLCAKSDIAPVKLFVTFCIIRFIVPATVTMLFSAFHIFLLNTYLCIAL